MLIALKIEKSFEYMGLETDPRGILSAIHESMIYGSRVGLFPELHAPLAYLAAKAGLPIPFGGVGAFITKEIDNRRSGKLSGVGVISSQITEAERRRQDR